MASTLLGMLPIKVSVAYKLNLEVLLNGNEPLMNRIVPSIKLTSIYFMRLNVVLITI